VRLNAAKDTALVVIHTFEKSPQKLEAPLPTGDWKITHAFPADGLAPDLSQTTLTLAGLPDFSAAAFLLKKN
jgi:hypothetical protein